MNEMRGVLRPRATAHPARRRPRVRVLLLAAVAAIVAGCYPALDWREWRPDCSRDWCAFTIAFPDRPTSATRPVPVAGRPYPLTLHVAAARRLTFAVGVFDLGGDGDAAAARAVFEKKLVDDVGAAAGERRTTTTRAGERDEVATIAFDVAGTRDGQALAASARFVERGGHLVEAVVIGPADALHDAVGTQALDTFFTSLRLD